MTRTRFGTQVIRKIVTTKWWAVKRGIVYSLPQSLAEDLIVGDCHYCGVRASSIGQTAARLNDGQRSQKGLNGIDRVDNTKGYTIENCVSCCRTCNSAKGQLTLEEFRSWIERVYNHQKANDDPA